MISSLQYSGGGAATKCNEDVYQLLFFCTQTQAQNRETASTPCTPRTYSLSMKHGGWVNQTRPPRPSLTAVAEGGDNNTSSTAEGGDNNTSSTAKGDDKEPSLVEEFDSGKNHQDPGEGQGQGQGQLDGHTHPSPTGLPCCA